MAKRAKTELFPADKIASDNMPKYEEDDAIFVRATMAKMDTSCSVTEFGRRMNIETHAGIRQTRSYRRLLAAFRDLEKRGELVRVLDGNRWRLHGATVGDLT